MLDPRITAAAERLLRLGKVEREPVPVRQLAKLAGALVRRGTLPEDLSGFLLRQAGGTIVGVNTDHSETRQRFTIAHEIGHLVLHPQQSYVDRRFFPVHFRDERSSRAEDLVEIQANQFAADLLMPKRLLEAAVGRKGIDIEDQPEVDRVAQRFGVSTQALTYRLINLQLAKSTTTPKKSSKR
jgi:Zn-dependent peptidase ImmA (M78 family)